MQQQAILSSREGLTLTYKPQGHNLAGRSPKMVTTNKVPKVPTQKLNTGAQIPCVGVGFWKSPDTELVRCIRILCHVN